MTEHSIGSIAIEEVIDIYLQSPYYSDHVNVIVILCVMKIVTLENSRP